jgi:hypothetical protein
MTDDEQRRLARVALLRRAECDRAAATLEQWAAAHARARDTHARAERALELDRPRERDLPSSLRSDALRAAVTRRDEAREHRRALERALAEATSALEAARAEQERAAHAMAEAESRLRISQESLEAARRARIAAREERADEEALERRGQ